MTGLAFAVAPVLSTLASHLRRNSPDHNAKGTPSAVTPCDAQPPTACKYVVSGSLSLPAQGCFSPVPHGTRPLSVTEESLGLEGGPPGFTPDYSGRALLRNTTTTATRFLLPGYHRLWRAVPGDFEYRSLPRPLVLQPRSHKEIGLACTPFARHY